jgi:hypothetical protein
MAQSGRYIVAEVGDAGTIGIWRREENRWVDLVPWTPSTVVRASNASNELTVQTQGDDLTLLANGTQVAQVAMGLDKGGLGVFVGGDGNQVVLERFTVQASASTFSSLARPQLAAAPGSTATSRRPPTPVATQAPTPMVDALIAQLDAAWAQGDWSKALILLERIEQLAPSALDFRDKRYVAHLAAGRDLLAKGNRVTAAEQLQLPIPWIPTAVKLRQH